MGKPTNEDLENAKLQAQIVPEERYGIEVTKKVLKVVLHIALQTVEALDDGKISLLEGIKIALQVPKLAGFVGDRAELLLELKDISREEMEELKTMVKHEFKVTHDNKATQLVFNGFTILNLIYKSVELIKE